MLVPKIANAIWLQSQRHANRRFEVGCQNVASVQQKKLLTYLQRNASTVFGRTHEFSHINSYEAFQRHVPVRTYDEFQTWIDQIDRPDCKVLTDEAITRFDMTSGTTSAPRLIPVTKGLSLEFESAVATWMCTLNTHQPQTFSGKAYWSLSPPMMETVSSVAGIPIGTSDDTAYFQPLKRLLIKQILAVSPSTVLIKDENEFYTSTLKRLLSCKDLSFVSVWSPSFLLRLDEFLRTRRQTFLKWSENASTLTNQRRKKLLTGLDSNDFTWNSLWANLTTLSCWTHASSAAFMPDVLRAVGDSVHIQPKGLLATEGVSTIPVHPKIDPVLSIHTHFYEFRDTSTGQVFPAEQLERGAWYEVVLTTAGGFYRYATGDVVEVTGAYHNAPSMRFVGRDQTSDMVGEKVSEALVNELIRIMGRYIEHFNCAFMLPTHSSKPYYELWIEAINSSEPVNLDMLRDKAEAFLMGNPYYTQARKLGQLDAIQIKIVNGGLKAFVCEQLYTSGRVAGAVKVPSLLNVEMALQVRAHYEQVSNS